MKKTLLFLGALLVAVGFTSSARAATDWTITDFNSAMTIQSDGKVAVDETIAVDFGGVAKHGIFRNIPYEYVATDGTKTYSEYEDVRVTQNGQTANVDSTYTSGYLLLKIGDPDVTVSGKQTYNIHYLVTGVLRGFAGYDELYWNATGDQWDVPILHATATVTLPKAGIVQSSCYQGTYSSTDPCGVANKDTAVTFTASKTLEPDSGMTVAVGYTKGMVPLLTVSSPPSNFSVWLKKISLPQVAIGFIAALLLGIFWIIRYWWKVGRDASEQGAKVSNVIAPEYEAPEGLRPAEIGLLLDERADTVDVSATIVDLAVRGYLTITEVPKKWMFGSSDYTLTKLEKSPDGLMKYETMLLDSLFGGDAEVSLSSLKNTFYEKLANIKKELYEELTRKEFFATNPEKVRAAALTQGGLLMLAGVAFIFVGVKTPVSVLVGIGPSVVIVGLILMVVSGAMPRRTAAGRELYRKVLGYKMFLSATEKYRQPFFEKKNMFMEVLPYAIVFGVTEKLAKAMSQMGIEPQQPGWYHGSTAFNMVAFGSSMNSFSSGLNSAMASTPGGSGSGGGGFSGGGFGGGGGGSW